LFSLAFLLIGCSMPRPETAMTESGVRFVLEAPLATKVAVVGDFNRWDPEKDLLAGPDQNGYWTRTIPMNAGRYEYLFLMNGTIWVPDPAAFSVDDGLGAANSVILVDKPE
jgi:1,4-alpha-glucan branching enzyme